MVILRKMTADEYLRFKAYSIADYANDLMSGKGFDREQALKVSQAEFSEVLSEGQETEGQFLMTVEETKMGKNVGWIWFFCEEDGDIRQVWLSDFLIYEEERQKGYAKAALTEMERTAKTAGCVRSVLYVWDHNLPGRSLYQKCGYVTALRKEGGSVMRKDL